MTTTEPKSAGQLRGVGIAKIKAAPWNPANRVDERRLRRLQESIEDIGLIYPVVLSEDMQLVDGHRRLAVAKRMGWETIPALIIHSELEHAYGSMQDNVERLSGNDLIGIWLSNPKVLIGKQRRKIERIQEICGRDSLKMLYKCGKSPGAFDRAMEVVRYCEGKLDPAFVLSWMVRHDMTSRIRHLLDGGISRTALQTAVTGDRPIKFRTVAEE